MNPADQRRAPGMLLIGSESRNAGKTLLVCRILATFTSRRSINAFKVTMLHDHEPVCALGAEGCDACADHPGTFCLATETSSSGTKDTQRLLAAGAHTVYWLRTRPPYLEAGARALLTALGTKIASVGESNRLRTCVEPDLFLMVRRHGAEAKPSARAVCDYVDCLIDNDGSTFDLDLERLRLTENRWALHSSRLTPAADVMDADRWQAP